MSNQSGTSPLQENLAEEEEEVQQQEEEEEEEDQQEEEDKNLQEPSQEPTGGGGGGDERKVATPPFFERYAANAVNRDPTLEQFTRAVFVRLGVPISAIKGETSKQDKNLQEPSKEPPGGGGGGDERKVATLPPCAQKTSIARKGPVLKPSTANATNSDPWEQVTRMLMDSLYLLNSDEEEADTPPDLKAKSLQASKKLDSPGRLPLGTPDKRPLENSAKDGVSQGKEKKIKDKAHGEDGEEGEGEDGEGDDGEAGGEENPRDDSASI